MQHCPLVCSAVCVSSVFASKNQLLKSRLPVLRLLHEFSCQTLSTCLHCLLQLGDAYHSLLELPCDLNPSNDRSLDDQLQLLHGVISRTFRQSGLAAGCEADGEGEGGYSDGGCFAGCEGGEGSDASGCARGVCGGDWQDDVEE